jgi:acetyl esterase
MMDHIEENLELMKKNSNTSLQSKDIKLENIEDLYVPGPNGNVGIRIYTPIGVLPASKLVIYMHGGGFVLGGIEMTDGFTRRIAKECNVIVISVEYGLAPEHPYPQGLNDSYAVVTWAFENYKRLGVDPTKIYVAGDSAGAQFAAVISQMSRDKSGVRIDGQILLCPPVGTDDNGKPFPSRIRYADRSILTKKSMEAFDRLYTGDPGKYVNDPYVHPIKASSFAGLPRALVVTCELDPLRDEGNAYAVKMRNAGVDVTTSIFKDKDHDYLGPEIINLIKKFIG